MSTSQHEEKCPACAALQSQIEGNFACGEWHALVDEVQSIDWRGKVPEIVVHDALMLGVYCCHECGQSAVDRHLKLLGAKRTDADVRPTEECAVCGADFDTAKPHHVVALSHEHGDLQGGCIQPLDVLYPARLCNCCQPVRGVKAQGVETAP